MRIEISDRSEKTASKSGLFAVRRMSQSWLRGCILTWGLAALVLASGSRAAAEVAAPEPRPPRIALVLSGGGALGLAHVGAIQELERMGIRPDLVVGTSMGSIVGGLYASGLDGKALEQVVQAIDWAGVFDSTPAREDQTYRQKAQQADFPVRASLAVDGTGLILPAGVISDQRLLQELRKFSPVKGALKSFDSLPIPFRAVATDIETGYAVVVDRGELPIALRASMAVPGVFAPIALDGRLLVDGGMAANIPITIARENGADIVIVVATPSALQAKQKIASALDVLGQTITLLILSNERAQLATLTPQDVLVMIDPGELTAADFSRGKALISVGQAAALRQAAALANIPRKESRPASKALTETAVATIDYVRVQNNSALSDTVLARKLEPLIGSAADPKTINKALDRVFALGSFDRVDYALEQHEGRQGMIVRAEAAARKAGRIRLGLALASDSKNSEYAVSADYRTYALDQYGSELQLQATLGDRSAASAELFKLLEPGQNWFIAPRVDFVARPFKVFDGEGYELGAYDVRYGGASLAAGYQFGSTGEIRVGLDLGRGQAKARAGDVTPRSFRFDIGRLNAEAGIDTLDNPYFPKIGTKASMRWVRGVPSLGETAAFQSFSVAGLKAFSRKQDTILLGLSGGSNLSGVTPTDAKYRLGGLFNLSGYHSDELSGDAFSLAQLIYRRSIDRAPLSFLGAQMYFGASLEAGQVWARRKSVDLNDLTVSGSLYLGANTPIGPLFLGYGGSDQGRGTAYLFLGRPF